MAESVDDMRNRALTRNDLVISPDGTGALQRVLSDTSLDVGRLCASSKINAASKCKPIKYNKPQTLTSDERLGMASEKNNGYYYGVKCIADAKLTDIHSIAYDYSRPNGGTNYYRLTDFIGYHHYAVPNVDAYVISDKLYIDVANNLLCNFNVDYIGTNKTGINLMDVFADIAGNPDYTYIFAKVYPVIAIGNMVSVLKNESGTVQPIYYNGAWQSVFYADLSTGGFSVGTYPVTLGFMFRPSSTGASFPIDGSWVNVAVDSAIYTDTVIVAFSSHNLQKKLETYELYAPKATPSFNASTRGLFVAYTFEKAPTSSVEVTAHVQCGGVRVSKSEIYSPGSGSLSIGILFSWESDLGMLVTSGMQIGVECYIQTRYTDYTVITTGDTVSEVVTVKGL